MTQIDKINHKEILISKILKKKTIIGVIGLGYVGLPLSILFAKKKFKVLGFDSNKNKVKLINSEKSYIERIFDSEINLFSLKSFFYFYVSFPLVKLLNS